jgi:hypothetical protein
MKLKTCTFLRLFDTQRYRAVERVPKSIGLSDLSRRNSLALALLNLLDMTACVPFSPAQFRSRHCLLPSALDRREAFRRFAPCTTLPPRAEVSFAPEMLFAAGHTLGFRKMRMLGWAEGSKANLVNSPDSTLLLRAIHGAEPASRTRILCTGYSLIASFGWQP